MHAEFRRYYLSGASGNDALYFRNVLYYAIYLEELVVGISPTVNHGCLLVAYFQAFDEYQAYLTAPIQNESVDLDLHWTALQSDLNEVAIALVEYIKKGSQPATLKEVTQALGDLLHVNLSNSTTLDNKRRNTSEKKIRFLEKLAAKSFERKDELDENQRSRKRRG